MRRSRHGFDLQDGTDAASPPIRSTRTMSADRRARIIARAGRLQQHYEERFQRERRAHHWRRAVEMGMVADGMKRLIEELRRPPPYR